MKEEFKINEYITVRLEGKVSNIYINEKFFRQCKFLLLESLNSKIEPNKYRDSIDEVAESLDRTMEYNRRKVKEISPEDIFWGTCSNLQAWSEMKYDTRLLHRNIAFPLLKELYMVGDPQAKMVLPKEVMKRYKSGHPTVIEYLKKEGYLNYLPLEFLDKIDIYI